MKKLIAFLIIPICMFFTAINVNAEEYHKVVFNYNGVTESVEVADGDLVEPIKEPKRDGYIFYRWINNKTQSAYDFNTPVTSDLTLAAQWRKEKRSDLQNIAAGNKDMSAINGVNPNEQFGLTPEKMKISLLSRLDLVTIGIIGFGIFISTLFAIAYNKEKKSDRAKETVKKEIIGTGKCHRCGTAYKKNDTHCKKCGVKILRKE